MALQFVIPLVVLALSGTLAVETPAPPADQDDTITVTGCLLLGPYGDYTLSKTIAPARFIMSSLAWRLEDNKQLLAHVLHKVEVTGIMVLTPDAPRPVGTSGSERPADRDDAVEYRLRVKTIKKISGCT